MDPKNLIQPIPKTTPGTPPPESSASDLPAWYPPWVREFAELFYSGTSCLYILSGNTHDLFRCPQENGPDTYLGLRDFLATKVFGNWDLVLGYDVAQGLSPLNGDDPARRRAMVSELSARLDPSVISRNPSTMLPALDKLVETVLTDSRTVNPKRLCLIFDYAQYLVPEGDLATLSPVQEANLIRFLNWAQNPYIKQVNIVFCLIADKLSEVNVRLVQNPHVATITVPLPDRDERKRFCEWITRETDLSEVTDYTIDQLADLTNGLNLLNLQVLLTRGQKSGRRVTPDQFRALKKDLIEQQCQGLLEFIEPKFDLGYLVGQEEVKKRLRQDATLLERGQLGAVPMGYLVCGPVGTGKSFLAECFAGDIGIPCVTLKNFRSKYVGETEGNLEHVLAVLRSLGPVVVVIDEADAALGNRQAGGDAGTSSRVFSMIARQMGDTRYRGLIIWMLLTSRPDLLPIDLKRQGRAEVHLPLFYPKTAEEFRGMIQSMSKKNKVPLAPDALEAVPEKPEALSGSDLESILLGAHRHALTEGRKDVSKDDLNAAFTSFLPSTQGLEKEKQELAAVLECTDIEFLPDHWRAKVTAPEGRTRLHERLVALNQMLREM